MDSPHKEPVTRKMFPFDDVIMLIIDAPADALAHNNANRKLSKFNIFLQSVIGQCGFFDQGILFKVATENSRDLFQELHMFVVKYAFFLIQRHMDKGLCLVWVCL